MAASKVASLAAALVTLSFLPATACDYYKQKNAGTETPVAAAPATEPTPAAPVAAVEPATPAPAAAPTQTADTTTAAPAEPKLN